MSSNNHMSEEQAAENIDDTLPSEERMETWRGVAGVGRASFPDQIDYYDVETGETV